MSQMLYKNTLPSHIKVFFRPKEKLRTKIFSDEVWALKGAYTTSYVTIKKDGSDRYDPKNL